MMTLSNNAEVVAPSCRTNARACFLVFFFFCREQTTQTSGAVVHLSRRTAAQIRLSAVTRVQRTRSLPNPSGNQRNHFYAENEFADKFAAYLNKKKKGKKVRRRREASKANGETKSKLQKTAANEKNTQTERGKLKRKKKAEEKVQGTKNDDRDAIRVHAVFPLAFVLGHFNRVFFLFVLLSLSAGRL